VILTNNVFGEFTWNGWADVLGESEIAPHQLDVDGRELLRGILAVLVDERDVLGETQIIVPVWLVLNQPEEVKTREQGGRQLDVLLDGAARVVAAVGGIGSGQDGDAGVESGQDAGLGDRDCLLLHHLVDGRPVGVGHLIKLVDAADAAIGQHQGATFQGHLARQRVFHHSSSQTDAARTSAGRVLT